MKQTMKSKFYVKISLLCMYALDTIYNISTFKLGGRALGVIIIIMGWWSRGQTFLALFLKQNLKQIVSFKSIAW